MSLPRAVAVVGFKDAGKTRVIEALIRELTHRGLKVGTIKHATREHLLDTPGKDTMRHREAGSVASAIMTSDSAAVFLNHPLRLEEAAARLGPVDVVVLEGFKSLDRVARIMVPRNPGEIGTLANGLEIAIMGLSTEGPSDVVDVPVVPLNRAEELADIVEAKAFPLLPGLNCGGCGYESCRDLAQAILAGKAEAVQCASYSVDAVGLKVDGRAVAMNSFVQRVTRKVVLALVSTLRGVEEPRRVELAFEVGGLENG